MLSSLLSRDQCDMVHSECPKPRPSINYAPRLRISKAARVDLLVAYRAAFCKDMMMVEPFLQVPLSLHDLPPEETYRQIIASLCTLQRASDQILSIIGDAVAERRGACLT
jgi:hypothetical protein